MAKRLLPRQRQYLVLKRGRPGPQAPRRHFRLGRHRGLRAFHFEILSNSIDEAREGYGNVITVTRYEDGSVGVEDHGRGCPRGLQQKRGGATTGSSPSASCTPAANTKTTRPKATSIPWDSMDWDCAPPNTPLNTWMSTSGATASATPSIFERGGERRRPSQGAPTQKGHRLQNPLEADLQVFTDIDVPLEYFHETIKRQAIVNAGVLFSVPRSDGQDL